mgnify:CR=1 FL=1
MFSGLLRTRERCPECNLVFERAPGYFTGAMYVSYTLGVFGTLPLWFTLLYTRQPLWLVLSASLAAA